MTSREVGAVLARGFAVLAICFGVLACTRVTAQAQAIEARGAGREQNKDDAAYKDLIEQALAEFKLRNWPEARVLFRKAHELNPNARTLRGMGVVSFEMRDYVQAVQNLSAALVDTRQPLTDAQRQECDGLLTRARTFVGSYALRLEPGTATATLDGASLVRDQDGMVLVPFGDHTLRGAAEGYQDAMLHLQVQGGERTELTLALVPEVAPATQLAQVAQAAAATAPQPASSPPVPEKHGLRGGGLRYTWLTLGSTAAFGGASIAFWYVGQSKLDDLNNHCEARAQQGHPCERGKTNTDTVTRYQRLTNASLGLTGASAVITGVLMALEWPRSKDLTVDVGLQSLSVRGKF